MSNDITVDLPNTDEQVEHLTGDEIREPKMYKVILFNDDFTTFEFVIYVLMRFFHKTQEEAEKITIDIHQKGKGIAGIFSYDEAETRKSQAINSARKNDFPLMCAIEPE